MSVAKSMYSSFRVARFAMSAQIFFALPVANNSWVCLSANVLITPEL